MRNGQSFMSIPLGRFAVRGKRNVGLLREPAFERWLASFRRACGEKAPPRFASALRQIDRAIFDFCRYGRNGSEHSSGDPFLQAVLIALGRAEAAIASAPGFRTNRQTGRASILPLAGLSTEWIAAADDGSAEYEIALALAGIGGGEGGRSIRRNLEPFTIEKKRVAWAEKERAVVWNAADLHTNLASVLARRLMDGARREDDAAPGGEPAHPLESIYAASLEAVAAFLTPGALDEERIADLLWGLILIETSRAPRLARAERKRSAPLPRAYALLKLLALPFALAGEEGDVDLAVEPALLASLRAGRVGDACAIAARRLRAKGFLAMPHRRAGRGEEAWAELQRAEADGRRLAAALLIPISYPSALALSDHVLRPREREAQLL
jgi:CRISPR-associated protein Csx17